MLKYTEHPTEGFAELRIDGKIDAKGFEEVADKLSKLMDERGKVGLLEHIVSIGGIEPSVLWEDLKFAFEHLRHVGPVAVVSDKRWVEIWTKLAAPLWRDEVKFFEPDELEEARTWLGARMAEIQSAS